jgi:hypothetical protein
MQVDAGSDAGMEMDAGTDAGTQTDAGTMTVDEGGACTTSNECMAGLRCELSGDTKKCAQLHLAVTRTVATSPTTTTLEAVVIRYKATTAPTKLSESLTNQNWYPRWNKDGTAVAFVEQVPVDGPTLVSRSIPLTAGTTTLATNAAAGGTEEFSHLEWAPSSNIAWTKKVGASTSGIFYVAGTGGAVQTATTAGGFPSWAADGNSFAFSLSTLGLKNKAIGGAETSVAGAPTTAEQPLHNEANGVVLYLDPENRSALEISGLSTPLMTLFTLNPTAATPAPVKVADVSEDAIPGGTLKSYIANPTWAPGGTHVAYVRTYYVQPTSGDPAVLCSGGTNCGGKQGNITYVQRVDATGAPVGSAFQFATEATLPSFSPDGHFIAYLSGGKLRVQQIDPAATEEVAFKVGVPITHTWTSSTLPSNRADDHRPRWQPR